MNQTTTPAEVGSNDQLGLEPERAKYHARGLGWALASALGTPGENWTADDVANAYADGSLEAIAEERKRIRAALMDMHAKTVDHNYYHCAVVTLFGA